MDILCNVSGSDMGWIWNDWTIGCRKLLIAGGCNNLGCCNLLTLKAVSFSIEGFRDRSVVGIGTRLKVERGMEIDFKRVVWNKAGLCPAAAKIMLGKQALARFSDNGISIDKMPSMGG